jgi:arginyl-tRNA synthetase
MIRNQIQKIIQHAAKKAGVEDGITLSHPADPAHGDFATSVALKHAKNLQMKPLELAQKIANEIEKGDLIEKVEVVKPGFINIFLTTQTFLSEMKSIVHGNDAYPALGDKNKKILLEYGQPNTHKTPHIGHLFSYVYGESLARILSRNGHSITRANYQGDIGPHVAKCLWALMQNMPKDIESTSLDHRIKLLQLSYQTGSSAYEENPQAKAEIDALNRALYEQSDRQLVALWQTTRQWSLDYYKIFEERLGIHFDKSYFETQTSAEGKEIVEKNVGKVFEKSNGAIIFDGEKYKLHTRVFINAAGNPTYEAKDIGLIALKAKENTFDLSIVTTANEQNEYWKVVLKAAEFLFPELVGKLWHVGFGMINLAEGKMSSRTGQIITAFSLMNTVRDETMKDFSFEDEAIAEHIAQAAVKYAFLHSEHKQNMTFDIKRSITREGDSGPYLLYTYVRIQSILRQAEGTDTVDLTNNNIEDAEGTVLRLLYQFPEVIEQAAAQYSPHLVAQYLFTLAQSYNLFYQKHQVLKAEGNQKAFRLQLTNAVGIILKSGLNLLGIETVEKM